MSIHMENLTQGPVQDLVATLDSSRVFHNKELGTSVYKLADDVFGKLENCSIALVVIQPGRLVPAHFHQNPNFEESITIISGIAQVILDGSIHEMKKNQTLILKDSINHEVKNLSDTDNLHLFVVCAPRWTPECFTDTEDPMKKTSFSGKYDIASKESAPHIENELFGQHIYEMANDKIGGLKNHSIALCSIEKNGATRGHFHTPREFEEVYTIIQGEGKIVLGDKKYAVKPLDSVILKNKMPHKLINMGKEPLELVVAAAPSWTCSCMNFTE